MTASTEREARELLADMLPWADRGECLDWIEKASAGKFSLTGCRVEINAALRAIIAALRRPSPAQPEQEPCPACGWGPDDDREPNRFKALIDDHLPAAQPGQGGSENEGCQHQFDVLPPAPSDEAHPKGVTACILCGFMPDLAQRGPAAQPEQEGVRHCQCFGETGLHASTHVPAGEIEPHCDLCGLPFAPPAAQQKDATPDEVLLANIRSHLVRLLNDHEVEPRWPVHERAARDLAATIKAIGALPDPAAQPVDEGEVERIAALIQRETADTREPGYIVFQLTMAEARKAARAILASHPSSYRKGIEDAAAVAETCEINFDMDHVSHRQDIAKAIRALGSGGQS